MDRRAAMLAILSLIDVPAASEAQSSRPMRKIGFLHSGPGSGGLGQSVVLSIMRPAWQSLGYVEGATVLVRSAEGGPQRLPALVAELIGFGVGVLSVVGPVAVRAAIQATTSTQIVVVDLETDPIRTGLASSIARPGGNITGPFLDQPSLVHKWLELLREAAPGIERVAFVWDQIRARSSWTLPRVPCGWRGSNMLCLRCAPPKGTRKRFGTSAAGGGPALCNSDRRPYPCLRPALAMRRYKVPACHDFVLQAPCEGRRPSELWSQSRGVFPARGDAR